jgi:phosphoglycerate dehydrogenase-like enzyme
MPEVILLGRTACLNQTRLARFLQTEWQISALPDEADAVALRQALPRAMALIALRWRGAWAGDARGLRLVQAMGAGVDAYEVEALPAGCALCNVYEHAVPMAEYVIGAMVLLTTRLAFYDKRLRQGRWAGSGRLDGATHAELAGRTVGLIGWGSIGREVARRARAFAMQVRAIRAHPQADDVAELDWLGGPQQLDELLATSDYLVVCCPLNEQTRGLLDAQRLAQMKPGAYLINVARGEIINEAALFTVLQTGRLAGAAIDVWQRYPENSDQILLPSTLPFHELENVLLTPHLAAWTESMIERRWTKIAANLDALATGRPLANVVALKEHA